MDKGEVVAGFDVPARDDASEVVEPREEPLDPPAPLVAAQRPSIPGLDPVASIRGDQFDPRGGEIRVHPIGVVGLVADKPVGFGPGEAVSQGNLNQRHLVGRGGTNVNRDGQPIRVHDGHHLGALAPLRFTNRATPYWRWRTCRR